MAEKIFFDPQLLLPIQRAGTISRQEARRPQAAGFDAMLAAAQSKITFSEHAKTRLAERGIAISEQSLAQLGRAVDELAGKGARESLVYLDGTAFVVSVPKRTVITAMDGRAKDNIITNIDSAAIL